MHPLPGKASLFLPRATGRSAPASWVTRGLSGWWISLLALEEPYEAPEAGYVVVYLSNESTWLTEVYFDDLEVMVEESEIIQVADYYPFGHELSGGYERVTAKENRFLFNGKERINFSAARSFDLSSKKEESSSLRMFGIATVLKIRVRELRTFSICSSRSSEWSLLVINLIQLAYEL